jgi:hypothetical protein
MNVEALVITTYPGHFLLTASTIQSYLKHNPKIPVVVVVDDLSNFAWPDYLADCCQLYKHTVIPVSRLDGINQFGHAPWYRQQMVKLHLDQLIPYNNWLSVDGDICFQEPLRTQAVFYTHSPGGPIQQKQNAYVQKVLGIESVGIWAYGSQMCVSNPPIRFLTRQLLGSLRHHITQTHNQSTMELHLKLMGDQYSVSEWELIENFRTHVLNEPCNLIQYHTHQIGNEPKYSPKYPKYWCLTCYATDQEVGRAWFEQQDIRVSDSVWSKLIKISR